MHIYMYIYIYIIRFYLYLYYFMAEIVNEESFLLVTTSKDKVVTVTGYSQAFANLNKGNNSSQ